MGSPNRLSDAKQARIVSRKKPWTDLDLSLRLHPIRKDIMPLRDDAAIKNSIRNLILTNFFERPFQPLVGADLLGILFEPATVFTRNVIKDKVTKVVNRYEPRVEILNIEITDMRDSNAYMISISYRIKEFNITDTTQVVLERLR